MAGRCGFLSRSLISTVRSSASTSSPTLRRLRPVQLPRPPSRCPSRSLEQLGCVQSLMPLHSVVAASRPMSCISLQARAYCELSQGS